MAGCKKCGAPLQEITCKYCGTRNDINLQEIHEYTLKHPETLRTCPTCNISLQTIDLKTGGAFLIERCHRCHGLFFDLNELQALIDLTVKHSYEIDYKKLYDNAQKVSLKEKVVYKKCPVCSKLMQRRNYEKSSGIIVDVCVKHGIWLDSGELKRIYEWVKAGGIHHSKEQEKAREKREARYEKERTERIKYDSKHLQRGSKNNSEINLFDIFDFFDFNL
ncbi:MAG: zf-TFIIB domain-containing protein [Campylobacterota bacterium]|nr:zf-TFIIB domain-containing protein [Campylobacterota bacterium]